MFATIIQRNAEHPMIYHGIVLKKEGNYFDFAFRIDGKNYIWNCGLDYWNLIE